MEDQGFIESTWDKSEGRRRRLYTLTAEGRAYLNERRSEWRRFAGSINAVLEWSQR